VEAKGTLDYVTKRERERVLRDGYDYYTEYETSEYDQ
jgi:hypothetical protein